MRRASLLWLLCGPVAIGCFQELDPRAASGGSSTLMEENVTATSDASVCTTTCPAGEFCLGGTCVPVDTSTPPIDLEDGGKTTDPCERTRQRALAIRATYCSGCHAPPGDMGGFDFVLDDAKLVAARSSNAKDDAGSFQRFVIPGDPENSRLYQRIVRGEMPPTNPPTLPANPRPNVSNISVLRAWFTNCMGASPTPPPDAGNAEDDGGGGDRDGG